MGAATLSPMAIWVRLANMETKGETVIVVAVLRAREDKADELARELLSRLPLSRREPGCLEYRLSRGIEDHHLFVLQEQWRSKTDLDHHFEMPYMKEWALRRDDFVAQRELLMLSQLG